MSVAPVLTPLPQPLKRNWATDPTTGRQIACESCGSDLYWHNCELTCERGCDPYEPTGVEADFFDEVL